MSSRPSNRKKKSIDPFMFMGTGFKDLDESRFAQGTEAHSVAVERLSNRAAYVPQPTPPPSDQESESEPSVAPECVFSSVQLTPTRPHRSAQRLPPSESISAQVVSHQRRQKHGTPVLKQPIGTTTGLSTPPASEKKKVVRMVRTPAGIVPREIEIPANTKEAPTQKQPIPPPNFGLLPSTPTSSKKEGKATPTGRGTVKKEPDSDDDFFHYNKSLQIPGGLSRHSTATKLDRDDMENPFQVFRPVAPSLSPFTQKKPAGTTGSVKEERVPSKPSSRLSFKTEDTTNEEKPRVAAQYNSPLYGLATPETTPTKLGKFSAGSCGLQAPRTPQIVNSKDLLARLSSLDDPYQKQHVKQHGPFQSFEAKHVPLIRLSSPPVTNKCSSPQVYSTDNGDELEWYQAFDVENLVAETMAREVMRIEEDKALHEVAQGKILAYGMGLGKTHVALSVIAETFAQMEVLYKHRELEFSRKPALIVADKSIQSQWADHATALFGLKSEIYRGKGHPIAKDADVIIVGIHMLRDQHKHKVEAETGVIQKAKRTPFFDMSFSYLVVDEFHQYGNPTTLSACALLNVKTDHFLLLSGTPAQNKLDDLQLPLALLQHPTKRKNFRELERALRKQKQDNLKGLKFRDVVNVHDVQSKILIEQTFITRRTWDGPNETSLISLPHREDTIVFVDLTAGERNAYDQMCARETGFVRLLRCRQASIDPRLLLDSGVLEKPVGSELEHFEDVTEDYDDVMMDVGEIPDEKPLCYALAAKDALLELTDVLDDDYCPSKTEVAIQLLRSFRKKGEKTLIFSNFAMLLHRLSDSLDDHGIGHALYHGAMSREERKESLATLANDEDCAVMLVSIKAGGLGLNITAANNVIIMDPWWNPYIEEQAIARTYRRGQTREVHVFRLIAPNTIENRMVEVQDTKRTVISAFMDKTAAITKARDESRRSTLQVAQRGFMEMIPRLSTVGNFMNTFLGYNSESR